MNRSLRIGLGVILVLVVGVFTAVNIYCRNQARDMVHNTYEEQSTRWVEEYEAGVIHGLKDIPIIKPEARGLEYEEVSVISSDGLTLNGWYIPTQNGAAVMLMHGLTAFPYHMLEEAAILQRHGYGALLISVRNHNFSDGDTLSLGCDNREMADLEAWYQFLKKQNGVDPEKIGLLGQSMGGSLVIQYGRLNKEIKAVVAHSAFPSVDESVVSFSASKTGLPTWLVKLIAEDLLFWAEREIECDWSTVSARDWIGDISPRAVYILAGGQDDQLPANSGQWLMDAANDPKFYWLCEGSGHHECDTDYPEEFETRIIDFFDQYLLNA